MKIKRSSEFKDQK